MIIQAYAANKAKQILKPFIYKKPKLGPYSVEIVISHCGICHSDIHLIDNDWKISTYPLVPGHEIIGHVVKKGALVTGVKKGDRVGVSWQRSSCLHCDECLSGNDNTCLQKEATCVGHHGGFADRIIVDGRFIYSIPKKLDSAEAAPLLCGGATVFAPLKRYAKPHMSVAIIGIGGLGHLGLQFASAFGCEVTALSSSKGKEKEAKRFGADRFVSIKDKKALQKIGGSFDFILSTSPADLKADQLVGLLKPSGVLCFVGRPHEPLEVEVGLLISGQKSICGSTVASRDTINEMLKFAERHGIKAQIELFPFNKVNEAIARLRKNQVRYRAVLGL